MLFRSGIHRPHSSLALVVLALVGTWWHFASNGSQEMSFTGGAAHTISGKGMMSALNVAARRRGCTAREAIGLFFATQTGNTESAATTIAKKSGVEASDIGEIEVADLAGYDGLIVGCPTWNTGADEYRSGTTWDDILDEIKGTDLKGKPVAVFGCGDSQGYGDNFCDGIEELHSTFQAAGAKMMGYVDASAYQHAESKSQKIGRAHV